MEALTEKMAAELIAALDRNTAAQLRYIESVEFLQSDWVSPEVTAQMLGIPITKSRSHRVRIANAFRRGLLTKQRSGRPPYYWKEEVQQLSLKIRDGRVVI